MTQTVIPPQKKRGRKSKKEIEEASKFNNNNNKNDNQNDKTILEDTDTKNIEIDINKDNIIFSVEEDKTDINESNGLDTSIVPNLDSENEMDNQLVETVLDKEKPVAKKRGRKPKGGKIVQQIMPLSDLKESKPNIILHLKCSMKDLKTTNVFNGGVEGYSFTNFNNFHFNPLSNESELIESVVNEKIIENVIDYEDDEYDSDSKKDNDIRDVWKKLKVLENYLHHNSINNKRCACFWDTCEFDNPPIYIPKHFVNNAYQVYGCFCSPECAVAHLMNEPIDSSTKFERYYLLNSIYGKIYDYKKNIKPAPNPYYMLEKFYGNLNIQEFRALLRNERLFLIVEKPLTRIMPELHEDNDDFIINNKIIPSNTYQIKKRLQKKNVKSNILNERFGLANN